MDSTWPLSDREVQRLIDRADNSAKLKLAESSRYTCYGCKRKNCTMSMPYGGCGMKTLREEKHSDKPALIDRKHKAKHFRKRRYNIYK